jgi:2-keto-4-pentenoate hydratase/2-oxohepta-3-ene-1,7-dioic acid hydratase in catechol pathway
VLALQLDLVTTDSGDARPYSLEPSKIVCVGVNYRAHAKEMGKALPAEPLIFLKPPSAMLASGGAVERPSGYARVDYEGELAVVIGRRARRVRAADAMAHVLALTCVNDITVRDLQASDGQWTRAKGFDGFCPIGPRLVAGLDPSDLAITTRVNGELRQSSRTSDLIFDVPAIIEFVSHVMTLEPGDVISTGTPSGVGNLAVGDTVVVAIEGVGELETRVVDQGDRQ